MVIGMRKNTGCYALFTVRESRTAKRVPVEVVSLFMSLIVVTGRNRVVRSRF